MIAPVLTLLLSSGALLCQDSSAEEWVSKLGGPDGKLAEAQLISLKREAFPALKAGFAAGNLDVRRGILRIAHAHGSQAAELAPMFARVFTEPGLDEVFAWEIAPVVATLGTGAARAAEEWSVLIADAERTVEQRGWAILGCATLKEGAAPAAGALLDLLSERPVSILQPLAAIALGAMPKAAVAKISKRLDRAESIEFTWLLMALVHSGEQAKPCARKLPPYALTDDWKQHAAVQQILSQCASEKAAQASVDAERTREQNMQKGGMYTQEVKENPAIFRELLKGLDPKFGDPEFAIDFPERLPARFIMLKFGLGDVEEGLGQHLLERLIEQRSAWLAGDLPTWAALHRSYDGLAGLGEALAVLHDRSPGRTQPK